MCQAPMLSPVLIHCASEAVTMTPITMSREEMTIRAHAKQRVLNWTHLFLLSLQLILLVGVLTACCVLPQLVDWKDYLYYPGQLSLETVLFVIASLSVSNSNSFFRVSLISVHLCSAAYGFYLIQSNIMTRHVSFKCFGEGYRFSSECFFHWPLETKFNVVYLGAATLVAHFFLSLLSIVMTFVYEGSSDYYEKMMTAGSVEKALIKEMLRNDRMQEKRTRQKKRRASRTRKVVRKTVKSATRRMKQPTYFPTETSTSRETSLTHPSLQEPNPMNAGFTLSNEGKTRRMPVRPMAVKQMPVKQKSQKQTGFYNRMQKANMANEDPIAFLNRKEKK